ncbi:hypothetical protein BC835DRAFT_31415 [Cytidiella melzeri]|nr:hypothetical protein BC835DRAFT_31415 [Cytidiella melzeri]
MSDYSSTAPSLRGPRSPLFGTATYSSLTTSQGPLSPSRRSSTLSYSDSRISSNDSEDASTDRRMRRINLSPVPSSRESDGYSYSEEDSIDEQDEVEAALTQVEEEIEDTLQAWTRDPITIDRDRRILSTITEHTENNNSRPTSGVVGGPRPLSQLSNHSRTAQSNIVVTPTGHMRSTTDPTIRPNTPGRGVSHIIAQFEAKKAAGDGVSPFAQGHSRTASAPVGPRSPSPYTLPTSSQTLPTLSTLTRDPSYTTSGFGSTSGHGYSSRPSSPTKSRGGSAVSGPRPPPSVDSRVTPALHSRTQSEFSESTGAHSRTGSFTNTFTGLSGTGSVTESLADTPSAYSLRRPQTSPRSPITQVTNIVAAWKGKTPVLSKVGRTSLTSSPALSDGGRRRRSITPRTVSAKARRVSDVSSDAGVLQTPISTGSEQVNATAVLPPPFDASEFGITGEPLNIGLLWYLNVHAPLPYRWQRCQAVLYPHMLLLTWIAPGGGRGIVTLDLLNCTEVRTALSPTHREARDDVGAIAAKQQSMHASRGAPGVQPGEDGLAETLSPFHLMYGDGIERLGTESPRERLAWVNAIWEVLERPLTIPDRSSTTSPVGSVRTIGSYTSGSSSQSSSVGSASTNYISPLHSGDILDAVSLSGTSSLSRKPSVASSQTRALDDNALSNQTYLPHADPRVIPPSRMSSLRRTSSLTDLDAEFDSALRRARNARPGLGFGLSLAAGVPMGEALPVTISSGARLGSPVSLTPPPRDRSRTRVSETASSVSEDPFFSASSTQTRTPTSSFYSTSSFTQGLTTTGIATDETIVLIGSSTASQAGSRAIASPTSYRDTASPSLLTASQNVTMTASTTVSPTRNGLTRSREVRRRAATITRTPTTSYLSGTEESSDKENAASYSGTRFSTDEYPSEFSTLDTLTRTEVDSYYSSEDWTRSGTPTPSTVSSSRPTSHFNTSESDVPPPSSSRTSEYYSAKSPTISLSSIPTIPSESDFETAEICSAPSDYVTVDVCRTGSVTDFETAEICSTVPASDFVTCEVCASDVSTEYGTARCHCATKAEEVSLETIELTEEREDDAASVKTPSVVPTIPSPSYASSELGEEVRPEDIPLPPTNYSPSLASTESLSYLELPPVPPKSPPTPTQSLTSSPSLPLPSPLSEPLEPPRQHTLSTISSPTESSITPTTSSEPSLTVPSTLEQPSASSPTIPESIWAPETDRSYESSVLRASPSTRSIAVPEGQDFSFETSIFRPTSVVTSGEVSLVTPVSQLSLTPSVTAPTTRSSTLTVPSTPTLPPSVPSPTPVSSERSPTPTSKTPSEVSTPTTPSLSSSIFAPSPLNLPSSPAPSTATSLLSTRPPSPERSPPPMIIPMPPSPSPSTPSASIVKLN